MSENPTILQFLKKHRDRAALAGLVFGFVIFTGVGILLQKSDRQVAKDIEVEKIPDKVEITVNNKETESQGQHVAKGTTAFYLKPSPAELLEQITSMEKLNENVVQAKFSGLRILWPVYFFSREVLEESVTGREVLATDVSPDGFGIMVKAEYIPAEYPEIADVEQGRKIWVGGEILAVDPSGTGVIYIGLEHVNIGSGAGAAAPADQGSQQE